MSEKMSFYRRWSSLLFVASLLVPVTMLQPYRNGPPIRSDGAGYHIWTRVLLDGELSFYRYQDVQGVLLADPLTGLCGNVYPPGLALLRFPVMAWLVQRGPGAPLFSAAEHWANLILAALALVAICYLGLHTCALLGIDGSASHRALLALVFGTGLFHYGTYDACFTHIYSALGASMLLWLGVRAVMLEEKRPHPLGLGLTGFFLLLIRNTNLILIGVLAVAYIGWRGRRNTAAIGASVRGLSGLFIGVAAAASVQLGLNAYYHGFPVLSSYGPQTFRWDRPMQWSVLFSYERGLFSYYPVVAVVLASAWAIPRTRIWAAWFSLLVLAYVVLYGFWWSWMLGGGFGHRGFVELMPLGMILFAGALTDMTIRQRKMVCLAALATTVITVQFMIAYWRGGLPCQGATAALYWACVCGRKSILWFLS
jgi:hypothetical protein